MLVGQFRRKARRFSLPHHAAITAQQSCSIKSLSGRDGMSETTRWKKCAAVGNFADAETFPPRHAGANAKWGFSFMTTRGDG